MQRGILSLSLALFACLLLVSTALAHERRNVGKYQFVVGFRVEPAFLDQPNGIDLSITNTETKEPVNGLEKTLKAQILVGGKTKDVELRAQFGRPGAYTADIIPTRAGTWAFRFFGTVEGTPVDERFESGPGRFNDVQPLTEAQFPEQAPSSSQLVPLVTTAQQAARNAENGTTSARTIGVVGIVVGALGLVVAGAGVAIAIRRK
ncbi:MAG: hypothetical protein HY686_03235 [Chloroflexi bacterium]|nr:hypothetical protein [Chloroflexota bacterium]